MGQYTKWLDKENLSPSEVAYTDLLVFMKYMSGQGKSQRTVQQYMTVIRHYYDYLLRESEITTNPASDIEVKGIKRKVLYHILPPEELHELYHRYPDSTLKDKRNKVMLGLIVYQGLKSEELGKLEINRVHLKEGMVDVPGGKRSNSRKMALESWQIMDMYTYVLQVREQILNLPPKRSIQKPRQTDTLFVADAGNCSSFSNLITQLMIKVRQLHPEVVNAKQLRASVITKWLKMYNLRQVQQLAGHRYISSTEAYQENEMEGLKEEVIKYHPLG